MVLGLACAAYIDLSPWLHRHSTYRRIQAMAPIGTAWSDARPRLLAAGYQMDDSQAWERYDNPEIIIYTRQSRLLRAYDLLTERLRQTIRLPSISGTGGGLAMIDLDSSGTITRHKPEAEFFL